MTVDTHKETLGFQAEVKQLLDLMVHSLYSNKEIFLRELVSNASDAIDTLRFDALSDSALYESDADFKIRISYDKEARTITVADNGIGMSRQDVIEHIGTIAKSGTREFFQSLTGDQKKDTNLIGQFGVGFYSAFVVAERVTLITRKAGLPASEGVRWESEGHGDYSIESVEKPGRGTEVILHLREGEDELLSGYYLRSVVRKYSDHIMLPIVMKSEEKDKEGTDEVVNQASALWTRSKNDITDEQYKEFYKHIAHDFNDPLAYVHSRMEGTHEYTLLLYLPETAPFDLYTREVHHGVKLYVRRVFIMDDAEKLMPHYLRFVRGIIDSSDLPLNVSREILQQNRLIDTIRSTSAKKILGLLTDLVSNEPEKYATFWKEFGRVLKEGLYEDHANHETIASLLRFATSASTGDVQDVSLDTYIARMPEKQDTIYYLVAENFGSAKNSPLLEIFKKKNLEVLLMTDPVDYIVGSELQEYKGKKLQSISKGEVDLSKFEDAQEKEEQQKLATESKDLLDRIKDTLGDKVKEVRVATRLTTSPACLVTDEFGIDPNLRRLLQSSGQVVPDVKPILEVNPQHPIIARMKNEQDTQRFSDWANVLLEQSILSGGEELTDPVGFVARVNNLLAQL
ncbi:MAG TPA: molecular chaperone HtpG [Ktedonobacteraceae bacterium]|nr:molecular chaperone HtpG [Ktedonobacteraceae bacterium]